MAKRDKNVITLGSGKLYMMEFDPELSYYSDDIEEFVCIEENLLGHIKGGAALEYTEETYEEKDDLGIVSKIITTSEEAVLKCGLLTWNGDTLKKLLDRCSTIIEEGSARRIVYIGGAGNAQGKSYMICFKHEDKVDGNLWVAIKGRNTAGLTLTFATDAGTVVEPEFKAMPQDEHGTLVTLIEEIPAT